MGSKEWIPVTEGLPEEHERYSDTVLVTVVNPLDGGKAVITSHTRTVSGIAEHYARYMEQR